MKSRNLKDIIKKIWAGIKVIKIMKNWPTYFKGFYKEVFGINNKLNRNSRIVYKLRNGITLILKEYCLNRVIFNEIWIYECYNPKGFEIKKNDTIIDIGSNYGHFSIYAALKAKKGKIYSFEPIKENFEILKENVEKNKIKNIYLINKAVSNKNGFKEISLSEENKAGHSFFLDVLERKKKAYKKIKVKTINLKDWIKKKKIKKIDFLKIDCEGAEYEILFSLKKMFKKIKKISIEVHYMDKKRNVIKLRKFLEENGFKTYLKPNYDTHFINLLYAKKR